MSQFYADVCQVMQEIKELLLEKNEKYGNSALEPLGIFSQLSAKEGLLVRIDDKLKRIKNGSLDKDDEDVINDLIGYLVLLKIHAKSKYESKEELKAASVHFTSSLGQGTSTNVLVANGHTIDGSWNYTNSKSHNED
jgi:hypothetical protein